MGISLVAFSLPALAAEEQSATELCAVLGVSPPVDWPPLFNDRETRAWFRQQLEADPNVSGWQGYYVVASIDGVDTLVGSAGYKGPPDAQGMVEVGYSIIWGYHRRGIATAAVGMLIERAFADQRVASVTAETPVHFAGSRALLEKCGFVHVGNRTDPEEGDLVLYAIARSAVGDDAVRA